MKKRIFFLAGPRREIPSGQDSPILPARVANQNAGFADRQPCNKFALSTNCEVRISRLCWPRSIKTPKKKRRWRMIPEETIFAHLSIRDWIRLRVVPHFSSGIVERTKRERAWKSPHARKAICDEEREKNDLVFLSRAACRLFSRGVIFRRAGVSLPWVPEVFSRVRRGASFRRRQRKSHLLFRFD